VPHLHPDLPLPMYPAQTLAHLSSPNTLKGEPVFFLPFRRAVPATSFPRHAGEGREGDAIRNVPHGLNALRSSIGVAWRDRPARRAAFSSDALRVYGVLAVLRTKSCLSRGTLEKGLYCEPAGQAGKTGKAWKAPPARDHVEAAGWTESGGSEALKRPARCANGRARDALNAKCLGLGPASAARQGAMASSGRLQASRACVKIAPNAGRSRRFTCRRSSALSAKSPSA
jgi:hypothetical protein